MARRAFVMGSKGPSKGSLRPLRFVDKDIERISKCLSAQQCGFDVEVVPSGTGVWEVKQRLAISAGLCSPDDTFVCHFSGHGHTASGSLFLLWDHSDEDQLYATSIPAPEVMGILASCKANSKLLILDCCNAGSVVSLPGMRGKVGELQALAEVKEQAEGKSFRILMASSSTELAFEFDELEGGFLSTNIYLALTEKLRYLQQQYGDRLSFEDLEEWLVHRAMEHNNQYPQRPVPIPLTFGLRRGTIFLTQGKPPWIPQQRLCPDGSRLMLVPKALANRKILYVSKHPVTNSQYRRFIEEHYGNEPKGEHFIENRWQGPFYPWRDSAFNASDQPVVCVSLDDASRYCEWVNRLEKAQSDFVRLPSSEEWNFAAFGSNYFTDDPSIWRKVSREIHDNAGAPASLDNTGVRSNRWGISDMIGNVWEWCSNEGLISRHLERLTISKHYYRNIEARGGGFLDKIDSLVSVNVGAAYLPERDETRHSDLGFRIAAEVNFEDLPEDTLVQLKPWLESSPQSPQDRFYASVIVDRDTVGSS